MGDARILEENKNFWEKRYESNSLEWHIDDVHPQLRKYLSLLAPSEGRKKKFFLPLCGKTKDICYLLSLGHEVFGVDCVKLAIDQLNEENNLGLKFDSEESLFYSDDRKLQILVGDFFTFPIEKWGPFDCVWDRGSFIAIDYPLRDPYIKVLQRSVNSNSGKCTIIWYE
jgi:thiopurine S-methyltransferase